MFHPNHPTLATLANTLDAWNPYFAQIGITSDLLAQAVSEIPFPSLSDLYHSCYRLNQFLLLPPIVRKNLQPSSEIRQFSNTWQLVCLSAQPDHLINSICTSNQTNLFDDLEASFFLYLVASGHLPEIMSRLNKDTHHYLRQTFAEKKDNNGSNLCHYAAWSGSVKTLEWVNNQFQHLMLCSNNNNATIVHHAAYSGSIEALKWINHHYPHLFTEESKTDLPIAKYAVLAHSLEILQWLDDKHPHLLKQKFSDQEITIAYIATLIHSLEILKWIDSKHPALVKHIANDGSSIAHIASLANSLKVLQWINDTHPDLIQQTNKNSLTIAHFAISSDSLEILQWINSTHPNLIQQTNKDSLTIAHFAISINSLQTLQWLDNTHPHLIETTTNDGATIAYYAAKAKSLAILRWLDDKYPHLIQQTAHNGTTIAYNAITVGSLKVLQWISDNHPSLINKISNNGFTIAHSAALNGFPEILQWIHNNYPHLLKQKSKQHVTIVHSAAKSSTAMTYLITEHPQLTKSLWIKDRNGNNPDAFAIKAKANPLPSQILHNLLEQAVLKIINAHDEKALTLISTFKTQTLKIIVTPDKFEDSILSKLTQSTLLEKCLGPMFSNIKPLLELQAYNTHEKPFTVTLLNNLIIQAKKIKSSKSQLFSPKSSQFIKTLTQFQKSVQTKNIEEEQLLDSKKITTLLVIIDDYQRAESNQHTKEVDKMLMHKLLATKTLSDMRQKPQITTDDNIIPENFEKHIAVALDDLSELVDGPILKNDVKQNATLVFRGIKHIIDHKDKILAHVEATPGVLYFLDKNKELPLHTDHSGFNTNSTHGNTQAYGLMLEHLVTNFLGAYYTAKRAGYLNGFLEKLSYGYCLEGRVRDTFQWVVINLSEIKSMDKLMEKYVKEYFAYEEVMNQKSEEELTDLDYATQFIASRHSGMPCVPHDTYASNGIITAEGIRKYMEDILNFEPEKKQSYNLA